MSDEQTLASKTLTSLLKKSQDLLDEDNSTVLVPASIQPINEEVKEIVTELNSHHMFLGKYPPLVDLKKKFPYLENYGPDELKALFDKVNDILTNARGCPPYQIKYKPSRTLDPEFVAACNLIFDIYDKRPVPAKLKDLGLTTKKFNNFLRLKIHKDFYENMIALSMDKDAFSAGRIALMRNVAEGDLPSIKYFNEMTGKFTPQKDFDPRIIGYLLTTILEIITRHVDSTTARVIADELETAAVKELGMG